MRRVCMGLPYCWQHLRSILHLAVGQTPDVGQGLFAAAPSSATVAIKTRKEPLFPSGELVVPYEPAELLSQAELDSRYDYGPWNVTGPYALSFDAPGKNQKNIMDAACVRSAGSLVNDPRGRHAQSGKKLVPNVRFWESKGRRHQGHVWLRATRPIYAGDEILVSYGPEYWRGVNACGRDHQQPCIESQMRRRRPIPPDPKPRRIRHGKK